MILKVTFNITFYRAFSAVSTTAPCAPLPRATMLPGHMPDPAPQRGTSHVRTRIALVMLVTPLLLLGWWTRQHTPGRWTRTAPATSR
jgi:hypothetical protein